MKQKLIFLMAAALIVATIGVTRADDNLGFFDQQDPSDCTIVQYDFGGRFEIYRAPSYNSELLYTVDGLSPYGAARDLSGDWLYIFFFVDEALSSGWVPLVQVSVPVADYNEFCVGSGGVMPDSPILSFDDSAEVSNESEPPDGDTLPTAIPLSATPLALTPPTPVDTSIPPSASPVPLPTSTSVPPPSNTQIPPSATAAPTGANTSVPPEPTNTSPPATSTPEPPTATLVPPTATFTPTEPGGGPQFTPTLPSSDTPVPPTNTRVPPTATPEPPTATFTPTEPGGGPQFTPTLSPTNTPIRPGGPPTFFAPPSDY